MSVKRTLDKAIKCMDAGTSEVAATARRVISEAGYNNSTGKYDKVYMALRSIFKETLLTGDKLVTSMQRELPKLVSKYVK